MKKIIGYIRVSTEEQTKGFGLDVQREKVETYCSLYNLGNVEIIEDDTTGKTLNRPGLQKVLEEVRTGNVSKVVVFKADRLTRKLRDLLAIIEDEFNRLKWPLFQSRSNSTPAHRLARPFFRC